MTNSNSAMIATLLTEMAQLETQLELLSTLNRAQNARIQQNTTQLKIGAPPGIPTNNTPEHRQKDDYTQIASYLSSSGLIGSFMNPMSLGPHIHGPVHANRDVNIGTYQTITNSDEHIEANKEVRILAAFAQPRGTTATRWEQESRALRQAIAPFARELRLDLLHGCTPDELHSTLLRLKPAIVHIQAHGNQEGLALQDSSGDLHQVSWSALRDTLMATPGLRCVILNACESDMATTLGATPFVLITTPGAVISETTLTFTFGFYDALAAGSDIVECYTAGCNRMRLQGYSEDELPSMQPA